MTIFNIDKSILKSEQLPHEDEASIIKIERKGLLDTYNQLLSNDEIDLDELYMEDIIELLRMDIILLSKKTIYVGSPIIKISILLHQDEDKLDPIITHTYLT